MRPIRSRLSPLLFSSLLLAGMTPAYADESLTSAQWDAHIRNLVQEAIASHTVSAPKATAGAEGFALTAADQSFQLRLRGYVQTDARFFLDDAEDKLSDTFLVRRARPILEGKLGEDFDFRIMPEFGGTSFVLQDAYVGYTAAPWFKLRAGKFKAPFGLERLQSGTDLRFVERAHPTSLGPNRDVGLQIAGDFLDGAVSAAVGIFNGVPDGGSADSDTGDAKDVVGRLFVTPFKNSDSGAIKGLSLGIAVSAGDKEGTPTASGLRGYSSVGQQSVFSYRSATNTADAVVADGQRVRVSPQVVYYTGPFGLLAEYVQAEHDVRKGNDTATLQNTAWQVAASVVLTGEKASFRGIRPQKEFAPQKGQWGALELVARYSELDVDDDAFPIYADINRSAGKQETLGVGVNWYATRHLKTQLSYDRTDFEGGAASGADRPDEHALFARLQAAF